MKLPFWVLVVCATQLILGSESALCSEAPSVDDLEKKAIRYRLENTKQGYVRLHVIDDKPHTECLFEITFDEQRVRQFRRYRQRGNPLWREQKIIVTPEKYIVGHEGTDNPLPFEITPATVEKSPREHFGVLNLQALGMSGNGAAMLHVAHVESLLNRTDRTAPEVHADVRDGIDTWRIDYEIKNPQRKGTAKVSLWIAPSQGFSVVGIYHQADQGGKRYSTSINTQMKQYPETGIWYPSNLVKILKGGDHIINRQVVTVEEARFGGPIDEIAFTSAGLNLKPGREVVDATTGAPWLKVWDGKELVKPSGVNSPPRNPVRRRHPRWLLVTLSVGLGLIAVYYFWRVLKWRRPTSPPEA